MRKVLLVLGALSAVVPVGAQQAGFSGPVEGLAFDPPTGSIRQVIGSLGSSRLGPPLISLLDFASVAPGQSYAIAVRAGQPFLVAGLGSGSASLTALPGANPKPEGVAWSGDGSAAVLYSLSGGWIQMFTGLPAALNSAAAVSVAPLGGTLTAVATDSSGQTAVVGIAGTNAGVYSFDGSNFSLLLPVSQPAALAISGGTLFVLDASTNEVSQISLSSSASQSWVLGADNTIALWPAVNAAGRNVLYVVTGSNPVLEVYDSASMQMIGSVPLSFDPTGITPLGTSSFVLRPRSVAGDPLWAFADRGQPAVYFVPAPVEEFRRRGVPER